MPKLTRKSVTKTTEGNSATTDGNVIDHPYAVSSATCIVVHDHDVLNGRGVNMAHHPGNERFRALIQTRSDPSYCSSYTLTEKKTLAEDIVKHIEALDPPGRFLKRSCKTKSKRGPWEIMSREEAIKKARQALRDCNRPDRAGYAKGVAAPSDVLESDIQRKSSGLTQQQYVRQLVATNPPSSINSGRSTPSSNSRSATKRTPSTSPIQSLIYPGIATSMPWITDKPVSVLGNSNDTSQTTPHLSSSTPTTAATSGGLFTDEPDDFGDSHFRHHHHGIIDVAGAPTLDSPTHHSQFAHSFPSSPQVAAFEEDLCLHDDDMKPRDVSSMNNSSHDPLQEEADAAALASAFEADVDFIF